MIEEELHTLIETIRRRGCEWQTMEVKAARDGCPEKLYDTMAAFANQDAGGVFVFGLDERNNFEKVGVYDAQALQKRVMEYGEQMTPVVRPVMTVCDEAGKVFVAAEIPALDIAERPCFKTAKGRLKGAYVRVGDADKPMTEYEVYSYEAFRKRLRDDVRPADEATMDMLDLQLLEDYRTRMRTAKPNLARLTEEQQDVLNGITKDGHVTMAALLLFGLFPQAFYPRLCITATRVPGRELGDVDAAGNRFLDTKRIEGTIPEMLGKALDFVRNNMRTATAIDPHTGLRTDVPQYPLDAVREAVLNALVHRDYSIYTETRPIQLNMFEDRLEITNPGGLYGRLTIDQLGHAQPDTRNPVLVTAMEILQLTENRYTGIPTIRRAMVANHLPEPVFTNIMGEFKVTLYHQQHAQRDFLDEDAFVLAEETPRDYMAQPVPVAPRTAADAKHLLEFCRTPRTRAEIIAYLQIASGQYALRRYLVPLLESGAIRMTIPECPRSRAQRFVTANPPYVPLDR